MQVGVDLLVAAAAPAGGSTAAAFEDAFWRIVVLVLIISAVWAIPVIIDLFMAYRYQGRLL